MFAALPLLALPVIAYNLFALTLISGFSSITAPQRLAAPIFRLRTSGGGVWPVDLSDVLIAVSLVVLFIELLRATTSHRAAIVNHALSMLLFVGCLVEMLLAPAFADSTFFLLTLMVLLDVLAGFVVTIAATRRELDFHDDR